MRTKISLIAFTLSLLAISLKTHGQAYEPSIQVPVTFFDYRVDGSNPDFNPGYFDGFNANKNIGL